jgi:hypothetical protein
MGGDDSQKLPPRRGMILLSGAQQTSGSFEINTVARKDRFFGGFPIVVRTS